MNDLIIKAREILKEGSHTCVFVSEDSLRTSDRRGVAPLVELSDEGASLRGFCAADKVVGAGAAYLYVLLEVQKLWAGVMSEEAARILKNYGMDFEYGELVGYIRNRKGDGVCPMERAVREAASPEDALKKIKDALSKLV